MGTVTAMSWMVGQVQQSVVVVTTAIRAIYGSGLQEDVYRSLAEDGPATVHELTARLGDDYERVRNAIYRLASMNAARCRLRVPSPVGGSSPRVVWAACDRDGRFLPGKQQV